MQTVAQKYRQATLAELTPHPRNPRQGDVGAIHTSIEANGFYGAVIVQKSTGHILAGNHRVLAAEHAGATKVPIIEVDCDDETALRILLADNRTNDLASYDNANLAGLLQELIDGPGLDGTGYEPDDLDTLLGDLDLAAGNEGTGLSRGDGLDVLDVSMGEPTYATTDGDVYRLGDHILIVADVHHDWQTYMPHLTPGSVFAPYPTPMLPLTYTDKPLVMVQPDKYLAGHVLDKYASRHGKDAITKVSA